MTAQRPDRPSVRDEVALAETRDLPPRQWTAEPSDPLADLEAAKRAVEARDRGMER